MDARTFVRTLLPAFLGLGLALVLTQCQRIDAPAPGSPPAVTTSTTTAGVHT